MNSPIFAEIVEANDERTIAALVLFDRRVRREFHGPAHLEDARAWVATWGRHLEREWDCVRGTTADIMTAFAKGLKKRGVADSVIDDTIQELLHHG